MTFPLDPDAEPPNPGAQARVPEPALVRSTLVAVTGIIALILGHQIDVSWIETAVTVYAAVSPIIAGLLIRPAVTPWPPRGRHTS